MKKLLVFPSDYFNKEKVDEDLEKEYLAAIKTGLYDVILFDYDSWFNENRLRLNEKPEMLRKAIYRGWMMKPEKYKTFYSELLDNNIELRISEFCGLTIADIDFKSRCIRVNKQLRRTYKCELHVEKPKSKSGERIIPMTSSVEKAFRRILHNRKAPRIEAIIDGDGGFLFLDKYNVPKTSCHWEKYMQHIREKYNASHREMLPRITPHVCRHTFCTKMAKAGMTPKKLQYIMGHADIAITMNTYTHMRYDDTVDEFLEMVKQL